MAWLTQPTPHEGHQNSVHLASSSSPTSPKHLSPLTTAAGCSNHLTRPKTAGQKKGFIALKTQSSGQNKMGTHVILFLTKAMCNLLLSCVA